VDLRQTETFGRLVGSNCIVIRQSSGRSITFWQHGCTSVREHVRSLTRDEPAGAPANARDPEEWRRLNGDGRGLGKADGSPHNRDLYVHQEGGLVLRCPEHEAGKLVPALIENLPFGLMATVEGGEVVFTNAAAASMLGRQLTGRRVRCCDLFGCTQPGTPLDDRCITELALRQHRELPEIRVDLPNSKIAAWVTASRVKDTPYALIHLRPGLQADRRRRTEPHWINGPRLRIRCLGPLAVESEVGELTGGWTQQRAGQVLGYLLCERHRAVHADELAETLWPASDRAGLGTVRYFVHVLRDQLEPRRRRRQPSTFIQFRSGGYILNRRAVHIDVDEFESSMKAGLSAAVRHSDNAEASLGKALQLYEGEFLADHPYADWARGERDRLHTLATRGLTELIRIRLSRGDFDGVRALRARLAEMEPLDDGVHRELIIDDLRDQRNSQAIRRYESLSVRLERELGRKPEFELKELARAASGE
jgi:DNA-binding SARP family transcriptional activator